MSNPTFSTSPYKWSDTITSSDQILQIPRLRTCYHVTAMRCEERVFDALVVSDDPFDAAKQVQMRFNGGTRIVSIALSPWKVLA